MGKHGIVKESNGPTGVKMLRGRVRRGGEDGTMTLGDEAQANTVVKLLNEALATEIVCVLRYKRLYFMAAGLRPFSAKAEFLQHAMIEQVHADPLAERIIQLGGKPNWSPEGFLNGNHPNDVEGESLREMITEDLNAKRIVIDSYREMVAAVAAEDPTTCRVLEDILAQEEEHAEDRASILKILGPESTLYCSGS